MENSKAKYLSFEIVSAIFIGIWYWFTNSSYNGSVVAGHNCNLIFYVAICAISFVLFFILNAIFQKRKLDFLNNEIVAKWVPIAEIAFLSYALFWNFLIENDIFPQWSALYYVRWNMPIYIFIPLMILAVVIAFKIDFTCAKNLRYLLAILVSGLVAIKAYTPNPFLDEGGKLYHIDAYVNSIINAMHSVPYSELNMCIYGHYAFLLFPFAKLIGGYQGIAIVVSIIAFISIFAFSIAGINLIKNDKLYVLFIAGLLLVPFMIYYSGEYWQLFPHRIISPAILICLLSFMTSKNKTDSIKFQLVGWLLSIFALIWNFEIGFVCLLTYAIFLIANNLKLKNIINVFLFSFVTLALAILMTGLANVAMGGKMLTIKDFVYPLLSDEYLVDDLIEGFYSGVHLSALIILMALICLIASFCKVLEKKNDCLIFLAVSLNILGVAIYYVNRPAYCNIAIVCFQILLLLVMICENFSKEKLSDKDLFIKNTNVVISKMCFVLVSIMAIEGVTYLGYTFNNKSDSSWNIAIFDEFEEDVVLSKVPEGTPVIGIGANILYEMLGWDNVLYITDFEDLTEKPKNLINDTMLKYEYILVSARNIAIIPNFQKLEIVKELSVGDYPFYYCKNPYYVEE